MIPPVLVTPPADPVGLVATAALRRAVGLDESETHDDVLLEELRAQAVARLDGWSGLLGRAILPQTWVQDFPAWGTLRLALPDVTEATTAAFDDAGDPVAADSAVLKHDALGSYVVASGPAAAGVRVTFTCAMPAHLLPSVREAVALRVAMRYLDREGLQDVSGYAAAEAQVIGRLRWVERG